MVDFMNDLEFCSKCKKPLLALAIERKFHLYGSGVEYYHNLCLSRKEMSEWNRGMRKNSKRLLPSPKRLGS
jgi:hypothetical protein